MNKNHNIKKEECILCKSNKFKLFKKNIFDYEYFIGEGYDLIQCTSCKLIRQQNIPSNKELVNFYPDDYLAYQSQNKKNENFLSILKNKLYLLRAKKIVKLIGNSGKILDIGCGNCSLLSALKNFGDFELHGIDIKKLDIDYEGLNIYFKNGCLEDVEYPSNYFDLVSIDNVIEHAPDPLVFLNKINSILKPGGWVVGTTPNIRSIDAYSFGKYWGGYHIPRHLYFFNSKTLERILRETGFYNIKYTLNSNPGDYCVSVQNYLRRNKKRQTVYQRSWFFPYFAFIFAPISFVSSIFDLNGVMDFVAQKNK